jgi:hypothetical protein
LTDILDGLDGGRECAVVAESPTTTALDVSTSRACGLPFKVAPASAAGGIEEGRTAALAGGTESGFPSPFPFVVAESVKALRRRAK